MLNFQVIKGAEPFPMTSVRLQPNLWNEGFAFPNGVIQSPQRTGSAVTL